MNDQESIQPIQPSAIDQDELEPPSPTSSDGVTIHEFIEAFMRRKRVMFATMVVVVAAGMAYTLTRRPIYDSTAKIVVATTASTGVPDSEMSIPSDLQALTRTKSADTQVEIISSPDLLDEAYESLSLHIRSKGFGGRAMPDWACNISGKRNTDVINVTGRAYDPQAAAALANSIAQTYFKRNLEQNNQATRQARMYAGEKMRIAASDLAQANASLSKFKTQTGLFAPDAQLTKEAEHMAQISLERDSARSEAAAISREIGALKAELRSEVKHVVGNTTIAKNPQAESITQRIDNLDAERASLLQEFTPGSREVRAIDRRIQLEKERLKKLSDTVVSSEVRTRNPIRDSLLTRYTSQVGALAAAGARSRALEVELNARKTAAQALPEQERIYSEHVQKVALLQRTYEMLSGKYYALLLREQAMLPNGMLVSTARVPNGPAYPDIKANLAFFLLLGAVLAVAAAMVAERLDTRVHDQLTAENLSGLATLSAVPQLDDDAPMLLGAESHNGAMLESFRILRNNIAFSAVGRPLKVIATTSAGRDEGKSTTTINLAVALAMEGKKVILVDGDLRRPSLHKHVEVSRDFGLTTVVAGTSQLEQTIVATKADGVHCLPSGPTPPNPAELLNSQPCRDVFARLREMYDVILLDCPPTTGLSDMQVLATHADGVLLVVSMNQTLKPCLMVTIRTLHRAGARLIGLVLNKTDLRRRGYGYYYYYTSYYDYAYAEDLQALGDGATATRRRHRSHR